MVNKLLESVTSDFILSWVIVAFLVVYFIYKELPEFKKRIKNASSKEINEENQTYELKHQAEEIKCINEKLTNDYHSINQLRNMSDVNKKKLESIEVEQELLIRSILAVLKGLQEIGANGPTKKAEAEIESYLIAKSHNKKWTQDEES